MDGNATGKAIILIIFAFMVVGVAAGVNAIFPRVEALGSMDTARDVMVREVMDAKMYTYPDNKDAVDDMLFVDFSHLVYDVDIDKKVHDNMVSVVAYALENCEAKRREQIELKVDYFRMEMPVGEYLSRIYRLDRACFNG